MNIAPVKPKPTVVNATVAHANRGFRNIRRSTSGTRMRSSQPTKAAIRIAPALQRLLDDAVDEGGHTHHLEDGSDPVQAVGLRVLALGNEEPDAEQRENDHGAVDQKDRTPVVVGQQIAGDQWTEGQAQE